MPAKLAHRIVGDHSAPRSAAIASFHGAAGLPAVRGTERSWLMRFGLPRALARESHIDYVRPRLMGRARGSGIAFAILCYLVVYVPSFFRCADFAVVRFLCRTDSGIGRPFPRGRIAITPVAF